MEQAHRHCHWDPTSLSVESSGGRHWGHPFGDATVMDRTVGWYAYGNMSWLLYLKLELGSPDDISELNR